MKNNMTQVTVFPPLSNIPQSYEGELAVGVIVSPPQADHNGDRGVTSYVLGTADPLLMLTAFSEVVSGLTEALAKEADLHPHMVGEFKDDIFALIKEAVNEGVTAGLQAQEVSATTEQPNALSKDDVANIIEDLKKQGKESTTDNE